LARFLAPNPIQEYRICERTLLVLSTAGVAWSGAFGLFAVLYVGVFVRPRVTGENAQSI
jgi:uncharacterized protein involved in response to NO